MRVRVVPELDHERMALEEGLHDAALHSSAASVNQADFRQTRLLRRVQVLVDEGWDIGRRERVQVELAGDGNVDRVGVFHFATFPTCDWPTFVSYGLSYLATTFVVMPPRAEKAPVTVMCRGWQAATRSSRILLVAAS